MPYIKKEYRNKFTPILNLLHDEIRPANAGELNYLITMLMKDYVNSKDKTYTTYNEVVGVLECAKQEFYRRDVSDYENVKIRENGDVT